MSEQLGPLQYGQKEEPIFIGKEIARHKDYSENISQLIDQEIRNVVDSALLNARTLLNENRRVLDKLAKTLLDREVLDRQEIEEIVLGKKKASPRKTPANKKTKKEASEQQAASESAEKVRLRDLKIATNEAGTE
jgi:cell division protease FtsH